MDRYNRLDQIGEKGKMDERAKEIHIRCVAAVGYALIGRIFAIFANPS